MVEQAQEIFLLVLMGLGTVLAMVLTLSISRVAVRLSNDFKREYARIDSDPRMLAFGQSPVGQLVHNQLVKLQPLVDEPDDQLIQQIVMFPVVKSLYGRGIVDKAGLSKAASEVLGLTIELVDGEADISSD